METTGKRMTCTRFVLCARCDMDKMLFWLIVIAALLMMSVLYGMSVPG
jgi:hypothetical protein